MAVSEPGKIRNVAVVGHRGTGKTSLVEAMLYQSGGVNRLGTVESGTTVSDWDDEEHKRQMTLSASLCHADWQDRKINLMDTPGDAGFQGDAIAALTVADGALVVVSAVMGVEVGTGRVWKRAEEGDLARVVFVNMLDRERADFYRTLAQIQEQLSSACVAVALPIGSEHEVGGVVDLLHMKAYTSPEGAKEGGPVEIPAELADVVAEHREKLLDAVVETDEGLMERYLEGEELGVEEVAKALKDAVTHGLDLSGRLRRRDEEPGDDGAARPARRGRAVSGPPTGRTIDVGDAGDRRFRVQDDRRSVRRPDQRVPGGGRERQGRLDSRERSHPREGAARPAAHAPGQGSRADPGVRRR